MSEIEADPELDLAPLITLINGEVQTALNEVARQRPANLRITSVLVAMGQDGGAGSKPGDDTVLRRVDYSLSHQGRMIEMAFGGGSGSARQQGGDWMPLPRPQPIQDRSREDVDGNQDRKGTPLTERWAIWKLVLQNLRLPFRIALRFFR